MELQFERSTIPVLSTPVADTKNLELTHELKLPEGMPDIGRVLSSWGQILIRSKEWNREELGVSGGVMVWTLYLPEDGTEPRSVESWIPFQLSWDIAPDTREGAICIVPLLRFVDGRGISSRKMMLRAGVGALAKAYSPSEREFYQPGEFPEDVELLKRVYPVRIPREAGEKVFALDEELTLPDRQPPIEKMIGYFLTPEMEEKRIVNNRFVMKGKGNLHLVYRCPEGKIRIWNFELPFSQFADLEGKFGPEAKGDIHCAVTNLEADLMDSGKLRVKAGMVGQYVVNDLELLELTEDAYSPFREITPIREELKLPSILDDRDLAVTARQKIHGQAGQSVDVTFLPDFPKLRRNGELELPAVFQCLYYSDDGSLQSTNTRWEGKLEYPVDDHGMLTGMPRTVGQPEGIPEAEGMSLIVDMGIQLTTAGETDFPMVKGLALGEQQEPDPGRPSLVLRRAGDEELWSLAKENGSTIRSIMESNGLQGEPEVGQMLLIPVM